MDLKNKGNMKIILFTFAMSFAPFLWGQDSTQSLAPNPEIQENVSVDPFGSIPEIVATVDGVEIKRAEVIDAIQQMTAQFTQQGMSISSLPPQYMNQFVERAIDNQMEQLILLKIAKKDGFIPSETLAKQAIQLFESRIRKRRESIENMSVDQREQLIAQVKQSNNMTLDEMMEDQIKGMTEYVTSEAKNVEYQDMMAIQLWVNRNVIDKTLVEDSEIIEFYEKNATQFETKESVSASHILITPEGADPRAGVLASEDAKTKAKVKMDAVLRQVKEGADFGSMAKEHSTGPSGPQEGSLGTFGRGQMVPAFEQAAFALEPGEVSGIVETQFGYHIIKVISKNPPVKMQLNDVKEQIHQQIEAQKVDKKVQSFVAEAKKGAKIEIHYEAPKIPATPMMPKLPK